MATITSVEPSAGDRARTKPLFWKTSSSGSSPAMRDGKWKFHLKSRRGKKIELYDLSVDPSESRNLADRKPEVIANLKAQAEAWVAELPAKYEKGDRRKNGKKGKRKN